MREIIAVFVRNGGFITFLLLESLCFFLLVNFNEHQAGIFSYSSGLVAGNVLNKRRAASQYISAAQEVDSLQRVVASLRTQLAGRQYVRVPYRDTFLIKSLDSIQNADITPHYRFIAAQIVSNSVANRDNWFMINVGKSDGIAPGMGVVLPQGIMGVVRETTNDFSICMSILHQASRVSARLKNQKVLGSLQYNGENPHYLQLEDVPKHVEIEKGDIVETSGFSTIFPGGIRIGKVDSIYLPKGSNFYTLQVQLESDPAEAEYVYVVEHIYREQLDSLLQNAQ